MTLRQILEALAKQTSRSEPIKLLAKQSADILDYEVVVHEAGEQADEVVDAQLVPEVKSIYLETA